MKEPDLSEEVSGVVDDVIDAFAELLTPAALAEARELLVDVIAAHPLGELLAERIIERVATDKSAERPTEAEHPGDQAKEEGGTKASKASGDKP